MTVRESKGYKIAGVAAVEAKEASIAAGLTYVSDTDPGITRVRRGKGFRYFDIDGKTIHDARTLQRIGKLSIPPAYLDVWICTNPRGHLQATGRDARGRKQYRYHAEWREKRDDAKFDRMQDFGTALPALRRQLKGDLALPGLPRERVLALIVSLLDSTQVRIGNAEYARDNKSFGLTTLRNRHAKFLKGRALLRFRGKSGVDHDVEIDNPQLARIVRKCHQLPGQQLFQFVGENGEQHAIDSTLVNEYLQQIMGHDFTAKDFRTWNATRRAIELLQGTGLPKRKTERALKACMLSVLREVAKELRNTPAVCRKSYINPLAFAAWQDGRLHRILRTKSLRTQKQKDQAALVFLKKTAS